MKNLLITDLEQGLAPLRKRICQDCSKESDTIWLICQECYLRSCDSDKDWYKKRYGSPSIS